MKQRLLESLIVLVVGTGLYTLVSQPGFLHLFGLAGQQLFQAYFYYATSGLFLYAWFRKR